ncbi:MAG: MFS transporter [Actinomycetota bacterium]|nr:MFS transporter [Actinomycetota bacterium]
MATGTFVSLALPNYRKFFAGQAVSLTGTWIQSVAMAWLILEISGSATSIGLAVAFQFLPVLVFGPYGGVLVDRFRKRKLLLITQSLAGLQAALLAVLVLTKHASIGLVLALSLMLGFIYVLDMPARQAFVREMVPPELVRNAVSLNSVVINGARIVGPAVAGVMIATIGLGWCFAVNAASFVAVIAAYASMKGELLLPSEQVDRAPGQLREGLRYVWRTPDLRVPLIMMSVVGMLAYEFQVVLPAFTSETFHGDAFSFGVISAAMGVGAVIGGLISATRQSSGIKAIAMASAVFGLSILVTALMPSVIWAAIAMVPVGAASIWFTSAGNSAVQLHTDPQMRGRVMSLWTVAFIGSTPIGAPIVGWIAETAGPRWALGVGAAAALGAGLYGARWAARMHRLPAVAPAV